MSVHEISYNNDNFRNIIRSYGDSIEQFKESYEKYIAIDIDQISKILWNKEPTPLTVLDYYKEMLMRGEKEKQVTTTSVVDAKGNKYGGKPSDPLDAVREAEKLLRPTAYYEHQFAHIVSLEERQSDAEFLYTLKLCYELGLSRSIPLIEELQRGIFESESSSQDAFRKLSNLVFRRLESWVYLSGPYYAMHDVCKDSIKFNDYVNFKITKYLAENFARILPKEDSAIYSFGIFLGRNIQFVPRDTVQQLVTTNIYSYMKSNRYFETGFGRGIAESFLSLDDELQKIILKRVEIDLEFARGLGDGLGIKFKSLDESNQQKILDRISSGLPFARFLGESLGRVFGDLSQTLKRNIFDLIEGNVQFADGVGMGIGYVFTALGQPLQEEVFVRAEKNSEFTRGLGYGLASNFKSLDKEFQEEVYSKAERNTEFAKGLGTGFGFVFKQLSEAFQKELFDRVEKNSEFAFGLGIYLGFTTTWAPVRCSKQIDCTVGREN